MSDVYKAPSAELQETTTAGDYGSVEKAIAGDYPFSIRQLLGEAWNNLKGIKTTILVATIIYIVVLGIVQALTTFAVGMVIASDTQGAIIGAGLIQQVVITLVSFPMLGGLYMIAIKRSVNIPSSFSELFSHFDKAGKLLLLYIVMTLMILVGFLLLVLPGIYLTFAYMMALPLMVEKNMGVWEALETSRKAITKRWFKFFAFVILCGLLLTIAMLPLLIGLIWAIPWLLLAYGMLYRNMFGVDQAA